MSYDNFSSVRDLPLITVKLLIKFQNILRNTTQVIIRHRVKILFSVISSPITLEWQKGKSSKMKGIFVDFHFCHSRVIGLDMTENRIFTLCRMITWVLFLRMFWNFISSLPVKRGGVLSILVRTIGNFLVMEIGWTDVGSEGYILVSSAHSNTSSTYLSSIFSRSFRYSLFHFFFIFFSIQIAGEHNIF
jgi:hypothetical protein